MRTWTRRSRRSVLVRAGEWLALAAMVGLMTVVGVAAAFALSALLSFPA